MIKCWECKNVREFLGGHLKMLRGMECLKGHSPSFVPKDECEDFVKEEEKIPKDLEEQLSLFEGDLDEK